MTWFKVDDKLHDHRKARLAGRAAMGLWVLAGSWAADNLSDGFVPAALLSRWGTRADAAKLVTVGLWHPAEQDGERGWQFHQWPQFQPTRAQKESERESRAEAGRLGGKRSGQTRRQAKPKQSASGVASARLEPPTRPDPTLTAAAAAVGSSSGATGPSDLPPEVLIFADKIRAWTPLRGLIFNRMTAEQTQLLVDLIRLHGDTALIATAKTTTGPQAPRLVNAYLGTWAAMPPPGQHLAVVGPPCAVCSTPEASHHAPAYNDHEFTKETA